MRSPGGGRSRIVRDPNMPDPTEHAKSETAHIVAGMRTYMCAQEIQ